MEKQSFKSFNRQLGWSTKLYVLLVASTVALSIYFDSWNNYWFPTILGAIAIVSFVDFLGVSISRHPRLWQKISWILLAILLALLFISGVGI